MNAGLRLICAAALLAPLARPQSLPAFQWIKEINESHTDALAGLGTDAQGNIYIAGSTLSQTFPTRAAIQSRSGSDGLFRLDSASTWTPLGLSSANTIAADPRNPVVLYAAANGQALRSTDGGQTFSPMQTPGSGVVQVAVDPGNSQMIYVASNEMGFLKSSDGGATWTASNSGIAAQGNGQVVIQTIWIDPVKTSSIYAAGQVLAHSTDAGATWKTVYTGSLALSLNFDTRRPGVAYLGISPDNVLVSVDGDTFAPIAGAPAGVFEVLPDPNHAGRLIGVAGNSVYESTDNGSSWTSKLALDFNNVLAAPGLVADWTSGVLYGATRTQNIVQVPADLSSFAPAAPASIVPLRSLAFTGGHLYATAYATRDVFVMKLDPLGNIVWSTYFGGLGDDIAAAMTVDAAGNVFVTGTTTSRDFPLSKGAYASAGNDFVFRLNSDGSLGYSTYFPSGGTTPESIAADASGSVWISGRTAGGLPVTPGAYQSTFCCKPINTGYIGSIVFYQGFLTRFDAAGSSLIFSTYVGDGTSALGGGPGLDAMALASDGSAYVADAGGIFRINSSGTALLSSIKPGLTPEAFYVAPDGSLYVAGMSSTGFQPTTGAFEPALPARPALPSQGAGSGSGAAIVKIDAGLKNLLAATYFAGTNGNAIETMTGDSAGNVFVDGYTGGAGLPTRTPLAGGFGSPSGFLAELSGDLSTLAFSSYFGDAGGFTVTGIAIGANGQVVLGGAAGSFAGNLTSVATNVWLNSIAVAPPPALRIDAVDNAASLLDVPISSGETIVVRGAGFTDRAVLTIGGTPVPALSIAPTAIAATVPAGIPPGAASVEVQVDGATSNSVLVPIAAAAPGVFSADHTGVGQGYILNEDGTLNTPSNPTAPGEKITVFATGVGPLSFTDCCAVTQFPVNVFIDGFYCNGVAAGMGPAAGFPGDVYKITVFVPNPADLVANNPNLRNFRFPPLVGLTMQINGFASQNGIAISIAQ
ncbi:MAG TPA: SBBP repeat-containing protein [Bryobacteraceae bacterium]|nr:SBBP repeat-containing protein [Bryobacteraceae bacterium]